MTDRQPTSVADMRVVVAGFPESGLRDIAAALLDRLAAAEARAERAEAGLRAIEERRENSGHRNPYPTEAAKNWSDGYITALATCSLIAREHLDPVAWAEHEAEMQAASFATDREWFERTGRCGHCGDLAGYCACTEEDPCGCGPHEPATEDLPCSWCQGSGVGLRAKSTRGAALTALDEGEARPELKVYEVVKFVNPHDAIDALNGRAVHCVMPDGDVSGILTARPSGNPDVCMVNIKDVLTNELIVATDIRNCTEIFVP